MSGDFPIVAVIDDDIAARRALARLLASQRYRVKQFSSAELYLEAAEADDVFCVLIDLHLGEGMSGFDLARLIRASAGAIPIIFMTGCVNASILAQAGQLTGIEVLEKPCRSEHLLTAIRQARAAH